MAGITFTVFRYAGALVSTMPSTFYASSLMLSLFMFSPASKPEQRPPQLRNVNDPPLPPDGAAMMIWKRLTSGEAQRIGDGDRKRKGTGRAWRPGGDSAGTV